MESNISDRPTDAEDILSGLDPKPGGPAGREPPAPEEPAGYGSAEPEPAEPEPAEPEPTEYGSAEPEPTEYGSAEPEPAEPEPTEPERSGKNMPEDNAVFIGSKHIAVYVAETMNRLSSNPTVTLKARGKKIIQAVNVSQMLLKRMTSAGCVISDVRISSESMLSDDGKSRWVSLMEIDISKD